MRKARIARRALAGVVALAAIAGSSAVAGPATARAQPSVPWGARVLPGAPVVRTVVVDGKRYPVYRPRAHSPGAPAVTGSGRPWTTPVRASLSVQLVNANSNKCLEVYNWSQSNGAQVDQWTCYSGHANQTWNLQYEGFVSIPGGSGNCCSIYELVNQNSGKCADATNFGVVDGTNIQQWTCNQTDNQEWLVDTGLPCYQGRYFANYYAWLTGRWQLMEVYQASQNNGARIDIYHSNGGQNQYWFC